MSKVPRGLDDSLRPLAQHLAARGVEFVKRNGKIAARYEGRHVTYFSTNRTNDTHAVRNTIATLKRDWPQLIEGYSGPGAKQPVHANGKAESLPEKKAHSNVTPDHRVWSNSTRLRLRTCIADNFNGSVNDFITWAFEVASEKKMRAWTSVSSARVNVSNWLRKNEKVLTTWALELVNAAIDEAYGTPEHDMAEDVITKPKLLDEELSSLKQLEADGLGARIEAQEAELRNREQLVTSLEEHIKSLLEQLEDREAKIDMLQLAGNSGPDPNALRLKYIDFLFDLAEKGHETALDRIERFIGGGTP